MADAVCFESETGESRMKPKFMTHSCGMSVTDLGDSEKEYIWGRVVMSYAMILSLMRYTGAITWRKSSQ